MPKFAWTQLAFNRKLATHLSVEQELFKGAGEIRSLSWAPNSLALNVIKQTCGAVIRKCCANVYKRPLKTDHIYVLHRFGNKNDVNATTPKQSYTKNG